MYSDVEKKGYHIGLKLGLTPRQTMEAIRIYKDISTHPEWDCRRSNYTLMVDCMFMKAKEHNTGLSQETAIEITKQEFGQSTQPRPSRWREFYEKYIL